MAELLTAGDVEALTMEIMKRNMADFNILSYCVYTVLMDADVAISEIVSLSPDKDSIAITFKSKERAKEVRSLCGRELVRFGKSIYQVRLKLRDKHLIASCEEIDD